MKYISYSLFLLFFGFTTHSLYAQQNKDCDNILIPQYSLPENSVWAFGDSLGLDFNTPGGPMAIQTSMYEPLVTLRNSASVSDSNGQLLFYTDGHTIWSANGTVMPNGNNISGSFNFTQVVQRPFQQSQYYLFTIGYSTLKCSLIDMSLNNGLGGVTTSFSLMNNNIGAERCGAAVADCSGNA